MNIGGLLAPLLLLPRGGTRWMFRHAR